jgi:hypothetical protein
VPNPASLTPNQFTSIDAADATKGYWYFFNGTVATQTGCGMNNHCSLATILAQAPAATVLTISVGKGSDYAFTGAVDNLRINNTVYDFEPNGVYARPTT